jgi:enterochelin esterase family protein
MEVPVKALIVAALLALPAFSQPGRGAPVRSPEVAADGSITFRLRAPDAKDVAVVGIGQRLAMQKNDQGIWSATTAPQKPDLYTYSFSVDGATVLDPGNGLLKTSYGSAGQSMVRVPGHEVWDSGDGPRGSVTHHFYKSAIVGDNRDYYVYTPPNYDANRATPYPVFFLLHGLGDDASGWTTVGAANVILDNLINQGKAQPMIMVNTLGYGNPDGPAGAMRGEMIPAFAKALVEEVLPQVEKNYRVSRDRTQHAIAGLSMGGAETVYTALHYSDQFAYAASFSGAFVMYPRVNPPAPPAEGAGRGGRGQQTPMTPADFEKSFSGLDAAKLNSDLRVFWLACGTEDSLMGANRQFTSWLDSKSVRYTKTEIPGFAHVWPLWRRNLAEFAPQLFQVTQAAGGTVPQAGRGGRGPQAPQFQSVDVQADRHVAVKVYAPQAQAVRFVAGDIPGNGRGAPMTKADNGVWEATLGPIEPGAFRYNFNIDGVSVIDPRNSSISESNTNVWSMFYVPGADFMDTKDVPHGAVSAVNYYSSVLKRWRRMHVYTPPGYELGQGKFPVFYLLHGAGDCDEAWTSVGRAGYILDNLIAAKKAKPMVVVMPAGHTSTGPRVPGAQDEFPQEFITDILPYAESHYRITADRAHRAIAGLSMGGGHTLNIAIPHLEKFAYVGVYSSGIFGIVPGAGRGGAPTAAPAGPSWEEQHKAELDNAVAKKGLKLLWFSTGVDDGLITTTRATVDMLKKHAFTPVFKESPGAHTWINWRNYLNEFAPQLFQ